jgi:hypothetical protein
MNRRSERRTFKGRVLDASLEADPRDYRIPFTVSEEPAQLKSCKWVCPVRLDQGSEGACVGFGIAHVMACHPLPQILTKAVAFFFYEGGKEHDEWPGIDYEGTSGNGVLRFLQKMGLIGRFYRIRTVEEMNFILSTKGPLGGGFIWKEGCFEPDRNGYITYTGASKGGHFVCINEINFEQQYYGIVQSWGRDHGLGGEVKTSFADMWTQFNDGGRVYWFEEKFIEKLIGKFLQPKKSFWQRIWPF